MSKWMMAIVMGAITASLSAAEKPEEAPKGEVLRQVIDVKTMFDDEKKTLTITATGQVPTGGWSGAKLTRKPSKEAPKDGIYEFDLTAIRPTGIVTQALSKVTATEKWSDLPGDVKGIKVNGMGKGAKTVMLAK